MKTRKMRANHWVWVVVLLGFTGTGLSMAAGPPERVNLQGVLRDSAGAAVTGSHAMRFHLYDSGEGCPGGGTLLWSDDQGLVPVSGGLFNAVLGGGVGTPGAENNLGDVFRNNRPWVEIDGETLCPRVRVESAAYAQLAGGLGTFDDVGIGTTGPSARLDVVGTTELNGDITVTGGSNLAVGGAISADGGLAVGPAGIVGTDAAGDNVVIAPDGGQVGIGTTNPSATLEVDGDIKLSGGLVFPDGSIQTSAMNSLPPDECFDNVGRFVVCGNGAVKDNLTGLFWLEDASCLGLTNWANANILARFLADGLCGLTDGSSPGDWRLPTKEEWQVIMDQAAANGCNGPYVPDVIGTGCCGTDTCAFAGVQLGYYWSSTTNAGFPNSAWDAILD